MKSGNSERIESPIWKSEGGGNATQKKNQRCLLEKTKIRGRKISVHSKVTVIGNQNWNKQSEGKSGRDQEGCEHTHCHGWYGRRFRNENK